MKRRALFILLLLIAGAIVNVAVAWGCAGLLPMRTNQSFGEEATAEEFAWWTRMRPEGIGAEFVYVFRFAAVGTTIDVLCQADPDATSITASRIKAGWPCLSLQGSFWRFGNRLISKDQQPNPYEPLWPGFAINTIFYAAILWLLFTAPFALRKRRRIKRGLCPKCAYPVGTSDKCTECGAARFVELEPSEVAHESVDKDDR